METQIANLRQELQAVKAQRDLLKAVLQIIRADLNVKSEQIDFLFSNLALDPVWNSCLQDEAIEDEKSPSRPAPLNLFLHLPTEISLFFFEFLDYDSICSVGQVCKAWYRLTRDERLWQFLFERKWCRSQLMTLSDAQNPVSWVSKFADRVQVERTWIKGKPSILTVSGHTGTVTCLKYNANHMISGSDDGSLALWELSQPAEHSFPLIQQHHKETKIIHKLLSYNGHGGPVWCLDFADNVLVSGSYDKTIKVWNVKSAKNLKTLRGHQNWVSCVKLHGDLLMSGGWDAALKLWNLEEENCIQTFTSEAGNVPYCIEWARDRSFLATGCRHQAIQVWDMKTAKVVRTFMGHLKQVYAVQFDDSIGKFISASGDNTIKFWDTKTGHCEITFKGHTNSVMACQFDCEYKMVSGSYDKSLKVWDIRMSNEAVKTLYGHSSAVFCLQFDHTKIVSGSADKTLRIWDFGHFQ